MKILITGAVGFIGYHLSKSFLKSNYRVYGIDSLNSYYSIKLKKLRLSNLSKNKNFYFKKLNLCNYRNSLNYIEKIKPDYVFHLAGQPGVIYSYKDPVSYKNNNILATENLIKIINIYKVRKFIFASSSSVYGNKKKFPIVENQLLKPENYYGKTKKMCENVIKSKLKVPYIIFRLFTVYGSLGRPDMFFSIFLRKIFTKKNINLYNYGEYVRDFTYIDDVIDVFRKAMFLNIKKKILNVCSSNPIKMNELIKIMRRILKIKIIINYKNSRKGEMTKTYGSNLRLQKLINKKKYFRIDRGIRVIIKKFSNLEKNIKVN
jgi:UDP-glucuronate 4-epimerase